MSGLPVVYLTFADDSSEHLAMLEKEHDGIVDALKSKEKEGLIQIAELPNASLDRIVKGVQRFVGRISIFHYAGHAGAELLRLEGGDMNANSLAQLLGEEDSMELVFLNGCATAPQVDMLLKSGVKAVIATSVKINDTMAQKFAISFYEALANFKSIQSAFTQASAHVEGDSSSSVTVKHHRGIVMPFGDQEEEEALPWGLYTPENIHTISDWTLPKHKPAADSGNVTDPDTERINLRLTAETCKELLKYNDDIRALWPQLKNAKGKLAMDKLGDMQDKMINCLPLSIGYEINRLFERNIDSSKGHMYSFSKARLNQLFLTYRSVMEFVAFIMLSQLWEELFSRERTEKRIKLTSEQVEVVKPFLNGDSSKTSYGQITLVAQERQKKLDFSDAQKALFKTFFERTEAEYHNYDYFNFILEVLKIFDANDVDYFLDELHDIKRVNETDGRLTVHEFMKSLGEKLESGLDPDEVKPLCLKGEQELGNLLQRVAFLTKYKLATITKIEIHKRRHRSAKFKHYNIELTQASRGKFNYAGMEELNSYTDNASVLFLNIVKDKLHNYLSMSPFIIDLNAIESEGMSRLYSFAYKGPDGFHYRFLKNPSSRNMLVVNHTTYPDINAELEKLEGDLLGLTNVHRVEATETDSEQKGADDESGLLDEYFS